MKRGHAAYENGPAQPAVRLMRRGRVGMLMLVIAMVGCGSAEQASPYAEDFREARQLATSDFERDVLADDQVSRAEYEEAIQRYVSCLNDGGVFVDLIDQHGYYIYELPQETARYDQLSLSCGAGTVDLIEPLYVETFTNPEKLHPDEATARCFVGVGLVDEPFGADEFRALEAASGSSRGEELGVPLDPKAVDIMESPDAQACMANFNYHRIKTEGP